jgi:hypothetical protein
VSTAAARIRIGKIHKHAGRSFEDKLTRRLCGQTSSWLPLTAGEPYWSIPAPLSSARVQSGDLLFHDAQLPNGERARRDRGARPLFDVNCLA